LLAPTSTSILSAFNGFASSQVAVPSVTSFTPEQFENNHVLLQGSPCKKEARYTIYAGCRFGFSLSVRLLCTATMLWLARHSYPWSLDA
jgi:hypothetical protein